MIGLDERSNGHALLVFGLETFRRHGLVDSMGIQEDTLCTFLVAMEETYGNNPYHNPIHAADALMSVHHFLCEFNFIDRLSREELLSVLVATIVHDFRHPGTTNAHEVKVLGALAITYSDHSPLESSHLAQAFSVLSTTGLDVLSGLGADGFRTVRKLMIDLVLHTDLSKHFEFIRRCKVSPLKTKTLKQPESESVHS